MQTQIKSNTNLSVQTGRNENSELYSQVYSFKEEASNNIERVVNPNQTEELVIVPDVDIRSAAKFILLSADGSVSDLTASRVAMSIRKYATAKSATPSNEVVSSFSPDTVVYGEMSNDLPIGTKNLAKPLSLTGGAIGTILAADSAGNATDYADNNAYPLKIKVTNNGISVIKVKIKTLYDPTPADHSGTLIQVSSTQVTDAANTLLSNTAMDDLLSSFQIDTGTLSLGTVTSSVTNNVLSIDGSIVGVDLSSLTFQESEELKATMASVFAEELGVNANLIVIVLSQGSIEYTASIAGVTSPDAISVTGVSITSPSFSVVDEGTPASLVAVVAPGNATDSSVTWSSSDTGILTVDSAGLVTAVAPGNANITVTTVDGGLTAVENLWANMAPTFANSGDLAATVGVEASLADNLTIADPDSDTLSYSWSQTAGATVALGGSTNNPTATFTVAGTYTFDLTVTDGSLEYTEEITIVAYAAVAPNYSSVFLAPINTVPLTLPEELRLTASLNRWAAVMNNEIPAGASKIQITTDFTDNGDNSILGSAGPATIQTATNSQKYTATGDLNMNRFYDPSESTMTHEIGHILGIGTLWNYLSEVNLQVVDDTVETDQWYIGTAGKAEYKAYYTAAGFINPNSVYGIPVEDDGGAGTAGGHVEEGIVGGSVMSTNDRSHSGIIHPGLDSELMTGWSENSGTEELSRVTIGMLADLGYVVNYAEADAYVLAAPV